MNYDVNACEELCEISPEFAESGVTELVCQSIKNDTGLNPSAGVLSTNCADLNLAVDCLIARLDDEVDCYETCDWKAFMHNMLPRMYTMFKSMLCSDCGLWDKSHQHDTQIEDAGDKAICAYDSTVNLVSALDNTVAAQSFVRYFRDNSGTGSGYEWTASVGANHTLDIYMDADLDNPGTTPADRDYVVIISNCFNFHNASRFEATETLYSSGDTRPIDTIRKRQGMHPTVYTGGAEVPDWSWNLTNAVIIREGEHVKLDTYVESVTGTNPDYRVHQVSLTWIPISPVGGIDVTDVMAC